MVDGHTNSLIIQAVKSDLERIMSLIETLDRPTPQILISANIVEATKDTARKLGIQWGGVYSTDTSGNNTLSITSGTSDYAVDFPVLSEDILTTGGVATLGVMFGKAGCSAPSHHCFRAAITQCQSGGFFPEEQECLKQVTCGINKPQHLVFYG